MNVSVGLCVCCLSARWPPAGFHRFGHRQQPVASGFSLPVAVIANVHTFAYWPRICQTLCRPAANNNLPPAEPAHSRTQTHRLSRPKLIPSTLTDTKHHLISFPTFALCESYTMTCCSPTVARLSPQTIVQVGLIALIQRLAAAWQALARDAGDH